MDLHSRIVGLRLGAMVLAAAWGAPLGGCQGSFIGAGASGGADAGGDPGGDRDAGNGHDVDADHGGGTADADNGNDIDATTDPGPADASTGGQLTFRQANLTNFTSYPDPGSDECQNYNGCLWAGQFAFVNGQQSETWVMQHNIVAVHQRDANMYKLKKLRLRQGGNEIDVTVYDMCADSDCSGCCTRNASETGFLIDIEKYTMERFGSGDGIVDFACLDCN